jgi:hypothetical protein
MDSLRRKGKKTLMIIGDSYTEGCCPDSVSHSFPDLLGKNEKYGVLNMGVAGTDLLQYELVARRYVPELKPDLVMVVVYIGNDIPYNPRPATPGIPTNYPFRKNKWISSLAPDHIAGQRNLILKTPEEAYRFFLDHYTLKGSNRNWFEKTIAHSVIFSRIYLAVELMRAKHDWHSHVHEPVLDLKEETQKILHAIASGCEKATVPYVIVCIPAPAEAEEGEALKKKYADMFSGVNWYIPTDLKLKDYDGKEASNHFNNEGHRKYTKFLEHILQENR